MFLSFCAMNIDFEPTFDLLIGLIFAEIYLLENFSVQIYLWTIWAFDWAF